MSEDENKPEGVQINPTFGKTVTLGQETYFNQEGDHTSTSLRVGTGLGEISSDGKTVVKADALLLQDLNSKNKDTGVTKARLNITAPIAKIGDDISLAVSGQSRTNLNLEDLGNVDDGSLNTSLRLPSTVAGKVGDYSVSAYAVPNITYTTGQESLAESKLATTLGAQVKNKNGTAVYGEVYKGFGTARDAINGKIPNKPATFGLGISTSF